MRKTTILLAAMSLAVNNLGMVSYAGALDTGSELPLYERIITEGQDMVVGHEDVWIPEDTVSEYLLISPIRMLPKYHGSDSVRFEIKLDEGWQVRRILIAQRDYEKGYTEEEADLAARDLGLDVDYTWAKVLQDITYDNTIMNKGLGVTAGTLVDNLPNQLYYALQVSHRVTHDDGSVTWEDNWWIRGKLDYRTCAHSKKFNVQTTYCSRAMLEDGKYMFVPYSSSTNKPIVSPGDEEIESWDDEWLRVQTERLDKAQDAVNVLNYNLRQAVRIMDTNEKVLAGLEVTLPKGGGSEAQMRQVENLKQMLMELREYYASLGSDGDNQAMLELLQGQKRELEAKLQEMTSKLTMLEEREVKLRDENGTLRQKNEECQQEVETLKTEIETLKAEIERLRGENGDLLSQGRKNEEMIVELRRENGDLQERIRLLEREKDDALLEKDQLKQENVDLVNKSVELNQLNTKIVAENEKLNEENIKLRAQIAAIEADNNREHDSDSSIGAEQNSQKNTEVNVNVNNTGNKSERGSKNEEKNIATSSNDLNGIKSNDVTLEERSGRENSNQKSEVPEKSSNQEVEVPNLGKDDQKGAFWWLIPVVALAGMMGAGVEILWRKRGK